MKNVKLSIIEGLLDKGYLGVRKDKLSKIH